MPFIYIYSPSDFTSPPPAEQGAMAAGVPTFTLTLTAGATPTVIEIADNDAAFDEVDTTQQTLASAVTIDGTSYAAGTFVSAAYDLINSSNGHMVTGVHMGGDGYQQGAIQGIASTVPLVAGQSYTFDTERTSHNQNNPYADYAACFTQGTMIATPEGETPIEALKLGDLVLTHDAGPQPIRWIGQRSVLALGKFAPVRFEPGALGNSRALEVSPEHRMLIASAAAQLYFGEDEVLAPAKSLVNGGNITRRTGGSVTYFHLLFECHQIIYAEGIPSEALLASSESLALLAPDAVAEARALFPELCKMPEMQAARLCLRPYEGRLLAA